MSADSLRTAMFISTSIMVLSAFMIFDLWQSDVARRVEEIMRLSEEVESLKGTLGYLESQTCEVDLEACRIQMLDASMRLADYYTSESNLSICYQNLNRCHYETIELSSECGI